VLPRHYCARAGFCFCSESATLVTRKAGVVTKLRAEDSATIRMR
jgi:hypothetical protein